MPVQLSIFEVVVADMARSLAFYRQLGLDIPAEADNEPHVDIELPGGLHIAFDTEDTIRSFDAGWQPPSGGHRCALAFACDSPADVDALFAKLVGAGATPHLEPWDAFWGMRYAVVHDPDGSTVDLFAFLPSST
jgi:catechol 2,3-dioxygenase-like lactoylglutathione lyase family enzyme